MPPHAGRMHPAVGAFPATSTTSRDDLVARRGGAFRLASHPAAQMLRNRKAVGGFSGGPPAFGTGALGSAGRRDFNEEEAIS